MSEQVIKGVDQLTVEESQGQSEATVSEDLESLRTRLGAAEQQRDEYLALLQRNRADFENYQKRVRRDAVEERRYAPAHELLPALDNLQRAMEAAEKQGATGTLVQGVAMMRAQLLDALHRFGITPINALGQPFDPTWHEAVMQQTRPDVAPGTVVQILEPGYWIHERVLRPARVVVAATGATEP